MYEQEPILCFNCFQLIFVRVKVPVTPFEGEVFIHVPEVNLSELSQVAVAL
jgi:hypothetical protein